MLRLDFASRGFYFCAYCAAFARAVILSARGAARFGRLTAQRDFSELRILQASGAVLQTDSASAVFAGRDFKLALWRSFQTAIYEPTARHDCVGYEFCIPRIYELRICFCKTGFDFKP